MFGSGRGRGGGGEGEVLSVSGVVCLLCCRGERELGTGNNEQHEPGGVMELQRRI